ncbi:hypothetical protein GGR51DRAFT_191362 [Nemania sp. FL0031]|nr:hypothetical protein GGR51DRAFT_191362 [Nemania sp. FL0031]
MARATTYRDVYQTDTNMAAPYTSLTDSTPSRIALTEFSADSMNEATSGLRSSLNDMLEWCTCLIKWLNDGSNSNDIIHEDSPMFNRAAIGNFACAEDGDYCAGWCFHRTPAKLGLISPDRLLELPIAGLQSPSIVVYGHQGGMPGYTCNLYIVPESYSAIAVLSIGTGISDTTEWIAQGLL